MIFFRWVTGSETLTVPNIKVEFHKSQEEGPYPRTYVCAGNLDIPSIKNVNKIRHGMTRNKTMRNGVLQTICSWYMQREFF